MKPRKCVHSIGDKRPPSTDGRASVRLQLCEYDIFCISCLPHFFSPCCRGLPCAAPSEVSPARGVRAQSTARAVWGRQSTTRAVYRTQSPARAIGGRQSTTRGVQDSSSPRRIRESIDYARSTGPITCTCSRGRQSTTRAEYGAQSPARGEGIQESLHRHIPPPKTRRPGVEP